jgi:IS30 family transposase
MEGNAEVVIAIDPHTASWSAAVVDTRHRRLGEQGVPASREGYRELRRFARRWPYACWAIEDVQGPGSAAGSTAGRRRHRGHRRAGQAGQPRSSAGHRTRPQERPGERPAASVRPGPIGGRDPHRRRPGCRPGGSEWKGRNKPHRGDRHWVEAWSPEQIANRLPVEFPDDESMRISHEAIHQALYVQARGALNRELGACLRTGRALRVPRARARQRAWAHVTPEALISERPAEAEDRAVPGPLGGRSDYRVTAVRHRHPGRAHYPVHDAGASAAQGWLGRDPRAKNGPALAGYGAVTMKNALAATITTPPEQLRRSLTWDRGKELSQHAQFTVETGISVYFADPHSPWQRGSNENMNGLLRQYFPKGTNLSRWSAEEINAVAHALNTRPRTTLGWKTPAEALDEHLRSLQQTGVATTD